VSGGTSTPTEADEFEAYRWLSRENNSGITIGKSCFGGNATFASDLQGKFQVSR